MQLFNECLVFLNCQRLREIIYRYLYGRYPFELDPIALYLLSKPVLIDIDVSQFRIKLYSLLLEYTNSLYIIAGDNKVLLYIKLNRSKEFLLLNDLSRYDW
jgi:hypothetical protein